MYKIVNLETFWIPENEKYALLKKEIGDATSVLGLMLADGFIHQNPGDLIEQISREVELVIVPGLAGTNTSYTKTIPFNFNLHTTYNSYKGKVTNKWNSSSKKFLFLGGVPDRLNRIGLFNKFRKEGLLTNAEWTFFKPWTAEQEDWCRSYTCDYDEILKYCRSIDTIYDSSKHYGTSPGANEWTNNTGWIDPSVYSDTALSIVSEGVNSDDITSSYLTEKTYRVFVQRHPFLHASNPGMFDYIKELGFKTFEKYMLIQDYAYLPSEQDRLDAIVINTKYFLENYHKHKDSINQDIEHNYDLFFKLAEDNIQILNNIKSKFNIDQTEIDKWFNKKGFGHLVRAYGN
jgi:hypothetical protein